MAKRKQSALDAMTNEVVRKSGADSREEYMEGYTPLRRMRPSEAGKGSDLRPCFVSPRELSRRKFVLWVVCPKCDKEQMRKEKCMACGAKLPEAKLLRGEK